MSRVAKTVKEAIEQVLDQANSMESFPDSEDIFGKLAEICKDHLTKGRMTYVEGRLQTRTWKDKQGNDKYMTEINSSVVQFLGDKTGAYDDQSQAKMPPSAPSQTPMIEDDIPF